MRNLELTPAEEERFLSKIDMAGECWLWKAGKFKSGYGQFALRRHPVKAHRVAYELFKKEKIPEGMCVLHSCDTPACCNPNHLRVGTGHDNMRDMVERKRYSKSHRPKNPMRGIYLTEWGYRVRYKIPCSPRRLDATRPTLGEAQALMKMWEREFPPL